MTVAELLASAGGDILSLPVIVYLFRQTQILHRQRYEDMKAQVDLFQKVALKLKDDD